MVSLIDFPFSYPHGIANYPLRIIDDEKTPVSSSENSSAIIDLAQVNSWSQILGRIENEKKQSSSSGVSTAISTKILNRVNNLKYHIISFEIALSQFHKLCYEKLSRYPYTNILSTENIIFGHRWKIKLKVRRGDKIDLYLLYLGLHDPKSRPSIWKVYYQFNIEPSDKRMFHCFSSRTYPYSLREGTVKKSKGICDFIPISKLSPIDQKSKNIMITCYISQFQPNLPNYSKTK